jgi:hypothetical protein
LAISKQDPMPKQDISDAARKVTIDRKEFDAALARLIATPPTPKAVISRKIRALGGSRRGPMTAPILRPRDRE